MIVAEANANGVRTSVLDDTVLDRYTLNDGAGIGGDLLRGEAEARGDGRVDAKRGGGTADGVLDAVEDIDDSLLLFDGGCDLVTDLGEQGRVIIEEFELNRLRRVGEIVDHVFEDLDKFNIEFGFLRFNLSAHIGNNFVNRLTAFGLQLHGNVAGVRFRDRGEAHLEAGTAGDDFDIGVIAENCFDVLEDSVCLGKRAAGGHDVVEDEAALVHLREQIGAEGSIGNNGAYDEEKACKQQVKPSV